jgi:hypothetical protein
MFFVPCCFLTIFSHKPSLLGTADLISFNINLLGAQIRNAKWR